ncbi:MAG: 50S ribosomal protein L15 [Patescibacteria group bacterium]
MDLSKIKKIKGNKTKSLRVGRGTSSGKGGHTVGKGMKGQKSRSGYNIPVGFEGGQVPLYKKLPTIGGFKNPNSKDIKTIDITKLNLFENGTEVTPASLVQKGIINKIPGYCVKVLAKGEGVLGKKLTLKGFTASKKAAELIEKSGSTLLPLK